MSGIFPADHVPQGGAAVVAVNDTQAVYAASGPAELSLPVLKASLTPGFEHPAGTSMSTIARMRQSGFFILQGSFREI